MCYIDFLILFAHAESKCHLILDYQFSFLKPGNSGANFLKFVTTYAEKVFDNLVVDSLLFHNKRILSISLEIKAFAFKATHILCGKDDT